MTRIRTVVAAAILGLVSLVATSTATAQQLNALDFQCFAQKFAQGDPYANCDQSASPPTLNAGDFMCYLNRFARRDAWADCDAIEPGWTDLGLPELTIYVSQAGSDSNSGLSPGAAVKSVPRARSLARDGHADFVLFRRGDTWNEPLEWDRSAGATNRYMVVGAYGSGDRPKFRTPQGVSAINLGTQARAGLAFVHLDLEPATHGGSNYSGVYIAGHWSHVLVEGCRVAWFPGNFVVQDPEQTHITMDDIKIRRCVITNSYDTGPGHSQGIFLRDCSNWAIEECVLDSNALNKADIFCHNVYINEGCGAGSFKGNISARACSHGVQQRPGGTMENNLFLQCPIAAYQGKSAYVPVSTNFFRFNVAIDSRDINATNPRSIAFQLGDADTIICEHNAAAQNTTGGGLYTTYGFSFEPANAATIRGNATYGWGSNPESCNAANLAFFNGGSGLVEVTNNKFMATHKGQVIVHATPFSARFNYHGNKYWTTNSGPNCYSPFDTAPGTGGDFNFWRAATGDTGSSFGPPAPVDVSIAAYMASIGRAGGLAEFMAEACAQEFGHWRREFEADAVNDRVRALLELEPNP